MGPSAIVVAFLVIYPLARALDLSFQKIRIARVGAARLPFTLENYSRALASDEFWNATRVSLGFVLLVTIDATGAVTDVKRVSGPGFGLDEAAIVALKEFRFQPATAQGSPVATQIRYTYSFDIE